MNIRIAFRVEEQRDVDLILGQGKLKAGWHAHKLNAPGKYRLRQLEAGGYAVQMVRGYWRTAR